MSAQPLSSPRPAAGPSRLWAIPGAPAVRAVWQFRGFVLGMVAREFRGRYLQSLFGSAWAVLTPAALIAIYTVIFAQVMRARLPGQDDTFAYSIFLCAGVLTWGYFSEVLSRSLTVFIDNAALLKKVSFPRITLPVILLLGSTVHFAIIFGIFLIVLAGVGRFPGPVVLTMVPLLILQQGLAIGLGVLLGSLNVFFRDVGQIVAVALQFWFWLTPIVYPASILSERARALIAWNPMTEIIGAYQHVLLAGGAPDWAALRWHAVGTAALLVVAFVVFDRLAGEMVDEL